MASKEKRKIRILILEDKERDAEAIKTNLESKRSRNWEAQYVKNLNEFREKIKQEYFDLYVIDYDIPADRGGKPIGGGEKALDALRETIGVVPAIIYSGVLEGELQETEVIKKGASYILQKGKKGSALAALIERIINEHDEKIGFALKSYFTSRLGEKTFYMNLIKEKRIEDKDGPKTLVEVEIQRLFDPQPITYEVHLNKNGDIVHAVKKET